jgi:hypothetical protein
MATYRTSHPGNLAIQQEIWTLTPYEAVQALTFLRAPRGSYWDSNLVKPLRRAKRAKAESFTVYTAGFSTGELSSALYAGGVKID